MDGGADADAEQGAAAEEQVTAIVVATATARRVRGRCEQRGAGRTMRVLSQMGMASETHLTVA
jgi:hypothetical protein